MGILSQATHQLKANKRNDSREILVLDPMSYLAYNKNTAKAWRDKNMDNEMNRMFQLILNEISGVKQEMSSMKEDISDLKQDVSGLKQEAAKTNSRLDKLEQYVTKIKIQQENEIIPPIKLLAEGQSVLPQMAKDIEKIKDKQEGMEIKLDALSEVVPQHSESIRELKKKAL